MIIIIMMQVFELLCLVVFTIDAVFNFEHAPNKVNVSCSQKGYPSLAKTLNPYQVVSFPFMKAFLKALF